jgi:hypothetical protein
MSAMSDVYVKARSEIIALFRWNVDKLSPDQALRLDCAVALRLALDDLQGRVVRGESIDVGKMLTAADALSRLLPPAALAAPPEEANVPDPREYMWKTYLDARRRGEISDAVVEAREVERLRAENGQLKAQLAGLPDVPALVETVPAPAPSNVVPLQPKPSSAASAAPAPVPQPLLRGPDEPWRAFYGDNSRWEV